MHSPEPWRVDGYSVRDSHGGYVYDIHPNDDYYHECNERCQKTWPGELATAERIVACVNACCGISTEVMKSLKQGELGDIFENYRRGRLDG